MRFFPEQKQITKQEDIFTDHGQGRKHQAKRRKKGSSRERLLEFSQLNF